MVLAQGGGARSAVRRTVDGVECIDAVGWA